ncbi:hypothetical protein [Pseudomonas sp. PSKL.D1]|uniref:hypothetical protein n=1 Tax=Pseudomonas sp. PSKL.D1 TaxID=3029060 RepID=UPI0023814607|nr:hypothetical protein [Pseudomonas sp. PSKL.D1]WDY55963.1 hypothetical protein PVV54_15270 [Pseudomonas sp. PSKL.D1]
MHHEYLAELIGFKHAARDQAASETLLLNDHLGRALKVEEIDLQAIEAHEYWHPNPHDFAWHRIPLWKARNAHAGALDIAIWFEDRLAGLCWASPQGSKEKIMVLYLQRNPDNTLPTRGYITPLCMSAVRYYALLLGLRWVVVKTPSPRLVSLIISTASGRSKAWALPMICQVFMLHPIKRVDVMTNQSADFSENVAHYKAIAEKKIALLRESARFKGFITQATVDEFAKIEDFTYAGLSLKVSKAT